MIVLNENELAESMLSKKTLGSKPSETLRRIGRYLLDNGYTVKEAKEYLDRFFELCDPNTSTVIRDSYIENAMKYAKKYSAINIKSIAITKSELDRISGLKGVMVKRLAFTLLCLAKFRMAYNSKCDYWVNNKDSEVMAMANINTSIRRQCALYKTLHDEGMIDFSKSIDRTDVRVCFADNADDCEPKLHISDFRNIGYQYMKYIGEPFFECENCGIVTKIKNTNGGRPRKYCDTCARDIHIKQTVNSVMNSRKNKSNSHSVCKNEML